MAHVSDCAGTLLKTEGRKCVSALCLVALLLTRYQSSHIVLREGLWWPFIFPVNGLDPPKSCDNTYRNSIHLWCYLCHEKRTQLLNEISNRAAFYKRRRWFTKALRGVFCHFVSTLIKEWQPYIHDYILCYLLWLQGQTNKPCTIAITFFIKPLGSYFPNPCLGFLSLCYLTGGEYLVCTNVSYHDLMRNPTSEYTWATFKSFFRVIALPSVLLIPLPIMFSVCLANWPQMLGFYKEKYIFSAAVCLACPESEVIIYLICSPNKLLTLIFVSQHVSSWFVIEIQ